MLPLNCHVHFLFLCPPTSREQIRVSIVLGLLPLVFLLIALFLAISFEI